MLDLRLGRIAGRVHGRGERRARSATPTQAWADRPIRLRPRYEFWAFAAPTAACAVSWSMGGVPGLTDVGFVGLAALCLFLVAREFSEYETRRSVARMVLYCGVLVWFCQDYFQNWFDHDFRQERLFSADLIARVATMHCLFVFGMVAAAGTTKFAQAGNLVGRVPEPRSESFYLGLVLALLGIGLTPYLFFAHDPFVETIVNSMTGFYAGGARFTFGRTGNLNYDWSGYLYELIKIGRFGGVLASFYAVLVAPTRSLRLFGWAVWAFWTLMAFGSGTRGELVAMALPMIVLLFIKYHGVAVRHARRLRHRVPLGAAAVAVVIFAMIQTQGQLRSSGFSQQGFDRVELGRFQGNQMFSEGLAGWAMVPDRQPPFYDTWFGEGALRAIPELVFRIAIHPVPRALWHEKPVDPVWAWHNTLAVGTGTEGTTVSTGLVGWWFLRFGVIGMFEGALVMGFMLAMCDRLVQSALAARRPFALMITLGLLTWIFRCFRDVAIGELWGVLIAATLVSVVIRVFGSRRT